MTEKIVKEKASSISPDNSDELIAAKIAASGIYKRLIVEDGSEKTIPKSIIRQTIEFYERIGEPGCAADLAEKIGLIEKAFEDYVKARDFISAVKLAEKIKSPEEVKELYKKGIENYGCTINAARLAKDGYEYLEKKGLHEDAEEFYRKAEELYKKIIEEAQNGEWHLLAVRWAKEIIEFLERRGLHKKAEEFYKRVKMNYMLGIEDGMRLHGDEYSAELTEDAVKYFMEKEWYKDAERLLRRVKQFNEILEYPHLARTLNKLKLTFYG